MSQKHSCGHEDDICDECHNTIFHFSGIDKDFELTPEIEEFMKAIRKLTLVTVLNTMKEHKRNTISYSELKQTIDNL